VRRREADGGGVRQDAGPGASAAVRRRASGGEFAVSFKRLQEAVGFACERQAEWEAKVVAGIRVVLDFAVANPTAARDLADRGKDSSQRAGEVIAFFSELLGDVAPSERRFAVSTDEAIVESVAVLVRGHLLAGTTDQLPELAPEVIHLALLPYIGSAAARAWAETAGSRRSGTD